MISYKEKFDIYLTEIENFLESKTQVKEPVLLYEPVKYVLSGKGKRIRPVLSMLSCGAVGGNPSNALAAGAAIEIMHNFTLVHDDIMDKSPLRRGKQTVHIKWDEPLAILTGDAMVGVAYQLLEEYMSQPNCLLIYSTLTKGLIEVCEGQVYDMVNNTKKDVTHQDYFITITKKTAKILETSCLMGGYAGNATNEQLKSLSDFAINLGIAFQIQDDLLDLMADEAELGKHIGQDIIEGKKTWLMIEARNKAVTVSQKTLINRFFDNNGLKENEVSIIREYLIEFGIIKNAEALAGEYFSKAKDSLIQIEGSEYKEMLLWLADTISKRKN